MMKHLSLMAGAALCALSLASSPANALGVKVGVLTCHVDSGWGYVLGSSKDVSCAYHPNHGMDDYYRGSISKFGVDIGYTRSATIVWDVVAPASRPNQPGALAGDYAGATASASVIVGAGAHVLLGGFDRSFALQPVSVEGNSGFDVAAGIGALTLRPAHPPAPPRVAWNPDRDFVAYFNFNSARLTPEAREVVAHAARRADRMEAQRIFIDGHTDTVGSESYNKELSLARAQSVRDEMVRDGVPPDVILVAGRSFNDPAVPTPPDVREGKNRRAVIDITEPGRQAER
jgi:outer membrane protein OmpA-like peptidoglycan-associated protein